MKALALFVLMVVGLAMAWVWFLPRLGTETTQWREEVLLASGDVLEINRTATRGPDEWFRPGRGVVRSRSMSFVYRGQMFRWTSTTPFAPLVLDVVDQEIIVLIQVYDSDFCAEFGYPPDGLVAFRSEKEAWQRADRQALPQQLRVNLLDAPYAVPGWEVSDGRTLTLDMKRTRLAETLPGYGSAIGDVARGYGESWNSCERIRRSQSSQKG